MQIGHCRSLLSFPHCPPKCNRCFDKGGTAGNRKKSPHNRTKRQENLKDMALEGLGKYIPEKYPLFRVLWLLLDCFPQTFSGWNSFDAVECLRLFELLVSNKAVLTIFPLVTFCGCCATFPLRLHSLCAQPRQDLLVCQDHCALHAGSPERSHPETCPEYLGQWICTMF